MTVESSLLHSDSEDIFAKAIERVEAGESVEGVLASVPVAMHTELREILLLITATHHLQRAPVPQPTAPRRAERKAAFLQAAAQMKAEMATVAVPTTRAAQRPAATPSFTAWLQNFWNDLQMGFAAPNLRLAPLVVIIIAVWVGAFGFVTVTKAAELGDLAYPLKQWIEYQDLSLSPIEARADRYAGISDRLLADLTKAADKLRAAEKQDGQKHTITSTELLIFEKTAGDYLIIGPLTVMMKYQPDPNVDVYESIDMPIMPSTDQQVEVTFQIIATEDDTPGSDFIVQGIAVIIPADQLEIGPTATPVPTLVEPTAVVSSCVVTQPTDWVPYAIRSGDTLSAIAQRTGSTVAALQQANCIEDPNVILSGKQFFAPALQQTNTPTATLQESLKVTLTAISTTVVTPSVNITATVSVVPTDTVIITATTTVTAEQTAAATSTITGSVTVSPTVVQTPTPSMTVTVVPEVVGTIIATSTMTNTEPDTEPIQPSATVTDTIDAAAVTPLAPTITSTITPAVEKTPTVTASATSANAMASPTPSASPSPTPTPTSLATQSPVTATLTPKPGPTTTGATGSGTTGTGSTGTGGSGVSSPTPTKQAKAPTPTSTPIPQNRSPLPDE